MTMSDLQASQVSRRLVPDSLHLGQRLDKYSIYRLTKQLYGSPSQVTGMSLLGPSRAKARGRISE